MSEKNNPKVLALIPARSGSKSVPHKNIRPLADKPLMAHSIEHALASGLIDRVIVSTDSQEYAGIARRYGAEVPFLRPAEISGDTSTDLEVFTHALDWLAANEGYVPDICVHLRPTYPVRKVEDIDKIIRILLENPAIDSVRTVAPAPDTPYKMWLMGEDGLLTPVVSTEIRDAYNLPRQLLPQVYLQNGCIDAVRSAIITGQKSMTGRVIYGYLMKENFDIDDESQLRRAEEAMSVQPDATKTAIASEQSPAAKKTYCFDIDGIIATIAPGNRYDLSKPRPEMIRTINELYRRGHRIILLTARGSKTGIDWRDVTRRQMQEWGVPYHELVFGKPAADYYIDDKFISAEELQTLVSE